MQTLSVIIPVLNASLTLDETLAHLRAGDSNLVTEIIVSDGGSSDQTLEKAAEAGCVVMEGSPNRGNQLVRGATQAHGKWLLFVHADTRLSDNWGKHARAFIEMESSQDRAAVFNFCLDDSSLKAWLLESIVAIRVRFLALPYGDQGLLISRRFYDHIGGFAPIPLMEDVDIIRKIGRHRLTVLPALAITSALRYQRDGYLKRILRNSICLALYAMGVHPNKLVKFYR